MLQWACRQRRSQDAPRNVCKLAYSRPGDRSIDQTHRASCMSDRSSSAASDGPSAQPTFGHPCIRRYPTQSESVNDPRYEHHVSYAKLLE
jgi:hypothetical protein